MTVYSSHVLPRLIDLVMRGKAQSEERAKLVPLASGVVLEIGSGSGLNARFFGAAVERVYALDPSLPLWRLGHGRLQGYWGAVREVFTDGKVDRMTKEILALAASITAKSDYGVDLHLREARRLGLTEQGLTEAVEVVQLFNTVTKIADALQLQPDFNPRSQP